MAESKHTPGPWTWYKQPAQTPDEAKRWLNEAVDLTVAAGCFTPDIQGVGAGDLSVDQGWLIVASTGCGPTSAANARLIAAAPELLEALRLVYDSTAVLNHLDADHVRVIADAIAKAEGLS